MIKPQFSRRPLLVFRRWSRKAWAVRAAIGKQVLIGQLSVDICNAAYGKSIRTGAALGLTAGNIFSLSTSDVFEETPPPPELLLQINILDNTAANDNLGCDAWFYYCINSTRS